jgi:hypothetical protein
MPEFGWLLDHGTPLIVVIATLFVRNEISKLRLELQESRIDEREKQQRWVEERFLRKPESIHS